MEIKISNNLVDYEEALGLMDERVGDIIDNKAEEMLWLLEHNPIITAGTSAKEEDILDSNIFPIYKVGRGGENTYHGPGQRVAYVMLDLAKRNMKDVKLFVYNLEQWLINSLAKVGVSTARRQGMIGIWAGDEKIAAIGIRVRKWVSFHGISININPNMEHYNAIVPCGISEYGVTSLSKLGVNITMQEFDKILIREFKEIF